MANASPTNHSLRDVIGTCKGWGNSNNGSSTMKRKTVETDDANPRKSTTKLTKNNKLLVGLLQREPSAESSDQSTSDLPQNELYIALRREMEPYNINWCQSGSPQRDYLAMDNSLFQDEVEHALNDLTGADLKDSDNGSNESAKPPGSPDTSEKDAVDHGQAELFHDLRELHNGESVHFSHESASSGEKTVSSPGGECDQMAMKYCVSENHEIAQVPPEQTPPCNFADGADGLMFQRMAGGHMMLPQVGLPPRPGGGALSNFTASRSPVSPSPSHASRIISAHLRQHSWNSPILAQELNFIQHQFGMQMSNSRPANVKLQKRGVSTGGQGFPVNRPKNESQTSPILSQQYSVASNPLLTMRFPAHILPQKKPISRRQSNALPARFVHRNMQPQNNQIAGMSVFPNQPFSQSFHDNGPMSVPAQQQNFAPYVSQHGRLFPEQQMGHASANQVRFHGPGDGHGCGNQQFGNLPLENFYFPGSASDAQEMQINRSIQASCYNLSDGMGFYEEFGSYQKNDDTFGNAPSNTNPQLSQLGREISSVSFAPTGMNSSNVQWMSPTDIGLEFEQLNSYFPNAISNGFVGTHPCQNLSDQQFPVYSDNSQDLDNYFYDLNQQVESSGFSSEELMSNGDPGDSSGN